MTARQLNSKRSDPAATGKSKQLDINLNGGQSAIWQAASDGTAKYLGAIAGTGGGKTWLGARWLSLVAANKPGVYIAMSTTYGMLNRTVRREIEAFLLELRIPFTYNKSSTTFTLRNGSVIYLVSADTPERIEGVHADDAWFDEAGQASKLAWETLQRRVGFKDGRIMITTTPYSLNWLKSDVFDRAADGDPRYFVKQWASTTNPYYPREVFEQRKREMSPARFKMMMLGQFTMSDGLVYPDWPTILVPPFAVPADWPRFMGLDWGYNHPTAAVWIAVDPATSDHYIYREYKVAGKTTQEHARALRLAEAGEYISGRWADPANKQSIADFAALPDPQDRMYFEPARKGVEAGIDGVIALIRTGGLYCFSDLQHTIDEAAAYEWERDRHEQLTGKPRKINDDLMDAIQYCETGLRVPTEYQQSEQFVFDPTANLSWTGGGY